MSLADRYGGGGGGRGEGKRRGTHRCSSTETANEVKYRLIERDGDEMNECLKRKMEKEVKER